MTKQISEIIHNPKEYFKSLFHSMEDPIDFETFFKYENFE